MVQSLDREPLAQEIDRRAQQCGRRMPVLLQVNIGREPQKGGMNVEDVLSFARTHAKWAGLEIQGLMAVMPNTRDETVLRPLFRQMRALFEQLRGEALDGTQIEHLSMGHVSGFRTGRAGRLDHGAHRLCNLRKPALSGADKPNLRRNNLHGVHGLFEQDRGSSWAYIRRKRRPTTAPPITTKSTPQRITMLRRPTSVRSLPLRSMCAGAWAPSGLPCNPAMSRTRNRSYSSRRAAPNNVVQMPPRAESETRKHSEMIVCVRRIEDSQNIINSLIEGKSLMLNLEGD